MSPSDAEALGGAFLHRVDLVFHEAGHVLFFPFGDFMYVLGGSLGQLLMPLIVMLAFLLREDNPFAASVALWWLGQSAMDLAVYIDDARALALPLLGGGTGFDAPERHDWNNLLERTGLLDYDHVLAASTYWIGRIAMIAAIVWGATILIAQVRYLRQSP
ncbi:MAG: hypothetical protein U1E83_11210 [Methylotetracoccus sp.]